MNVQTLLESANPWKNMQTDSERLLAKWQKSGLLEGLKSDIETNTMATLLENQAKQLVTEGNVTGGSTSNAYGNEAWNGVALPLVRRVFGEIAAKEFVSVQPMNLPSGLIFYMDFKYGSNPAGSPDFASASLYGTGGTAGTGYNNGTSGTTSTNGGGGAGA